MFLEKINMPAQAQEGLIQINNKHYHLDKKALDEIIATSNFDVRLMLHKMDVAKPRGGISWKCAKAEYELLRPFLCNENYVPLNKNLHKGLTEEKEREYVNNYLNTEGFKYYVSQRTCCDSGDYRTPVLTTINDLMTHCGVNVLSQYKSNQHKKVLLIGFYTAIAGLVSAAAGCHFLNKKEVAHHAEIPAKVMNVQNTRSY